MFDRRVRAVLAGVAAVLVCASSLHAQSAAPLTSQTFPIGTGGAQCEAQGVRLGEARNSVFDRKWALICSDVERPIGSAYSWMGAPDIERRVSLSRGTQLDCGEAASAADAAPGVTMRRCRDPKTGFEWLSYTGVSGDRTNVVEGLAAFDSALLASFAW